MPLKGLGVKVSSRGRDLGSRYWLLPEGDELERAMVAGLMLEVAVETSAWLGDPLGRRHLIKSRLRDSLLAQLAGRITLDRFRGLVRRLDLWFPFYYPLMPAPSIPAKEDYSSFLPGWPRSPGGTRPDGLTPDFSPTPVRPRCLKGWLEQAGGKILPRRPQRKLHPQGLQEFLQRTRGQWFRVKELALDFDIDGKTAWEYLQKLAEAGLLVHNSRRSAAVRYRLADSFLKVKLSALVRQVTLALVPSSLSGPRA